MVRLLGVLAAAALLAGCGDGSGHSQDEVPGAPEVLRLVSQTAGGGQVATRATPLSGAAGVERYVAGLSDVLGAKLRAAIGATEPSGELWAQVVAVGCDVPPGATARRGAGGTVVVHPDPVPRPRRECFAPVTTVALVEVRTTD
jgi:hypothetical protein